jgi:hypothetical protein
VLTAADNGQRLANQRVKGLPDGDRHLKRRTPGITDSTPKPKATISSTILAVAKKTSLPFWQP